MEKSKSQTIVSKDFEVLSSDEQSVTFKRLVNSKGRTNKEVKEIQRGLPTVTMHFFSIDDFNNLKQIEADIKSNNDREQKSKGFFKTVYDFLEI